MYKKLKLYKMELFMLLPLLLAACAQREISEEQNFPSSIVESSINVENPENSPDTQQYVSVDNSNQDILTVSAGTTATQTIETSAGGVIRLSDTPVEDELLLMETTNWTAAGELIWEEREIL